MSKKGKHIPNELVLSARTSYSRISKSNREYLQQLRELDEDHPSRAAAAVALKIDGHGYTEIAQILDYTSAQVARRAIENAIGAEAASPEQIDHIRWINARRLERLLNSVLARAEDEDDARHLEYAKMAVTLIDRHLKLYGADAPQQMRVSIEPSRAAIEQWALDFARQAAGAIEEADIIDVEEVQQDEEDIL